MFDELPCIPVLRGDGLPLRGWGRSLMDGRLGFLEMHPRRERCEMHVHVKETRAAACH